MVRENSPVAPCEQPVQQERGQSPGGFGCLETPLEGEQQGDSPELWGAELKELGFGFVQRFSCWAIAGWEVGAGTGLCFGRGGVVLAFGC